MARLRHVVVGLGMGTLVLGVFAMAPGARAGVPCTATCEVTTGGVTSLWIADTLEVLLAVRDCYGNPLVGYTCVVFSSRGAPDIVVNNPVVTDINGNASASVVTFVPATGVRFYFTSAGATIGPSAPFEWSGASPTLRAGAWLNPEPWNDWIGGASDTTQIQYYACDVAHQIDSVKFYYSTDGGYNWSYIATDINGGEPLENTYGPLGLPGDGWSAYLPHAWLPQVEAYIQFKGVAYFLGGQYDLLTTREYLPVPPSSVQLNIYDWYQVPSDTLYVTVTPGPGLVIDSVIVAEVAKQDTFAKGIPGISQQPHSSGHCAPTAVAACFKYFNNPTLVPPGTSDYDLVEALAKEMGTKPDTGTTTANITNGAKSWIDKHGGGYTVRDFSNVDAAGNPTFAAKDWKRMRDELERCQNVLNRITWPGGGAHRMTLNSVVNKALPNGHLKVDWMDPWTGQTEYGELDPSNGSITGLTGAGGGGSGTVTHTTIICPNESTPGGGLPPSKKVVPGPNPPSVPVVMPDPPGATHASFIHIVVVATSGNAYHFIVIVVWMPGSGVDDGGQILPDRFQLGVLGENPARGGCDIAYGVPVATEVSITIYDVMGRPVRSLASGYTMPGSYVAPWDAADDDGIKVSPGVYYVRISATEGEKAIKVILLR